MRQYNLCRLCGNIQQADSCHREFGPDMYCYCSEIQKKGFSPVYLGGGFIGWGIDGDGERSIVVSQVDMEGFPSLSDTVNVGFYDESGMVAYMEEIIFSSFFDGSDWSIFLSSGTIPAHALTGAL